jgi:hypothetical protein
VVKHRCLKRINPCQQVASAVPGARTAIAATPPKRDTIAVWIVLQTFLLPVSVEHKVALRLKRYACIRRKWVRARLRQCASQTFQNAAQHSENKNAFGKSSTRNRNWTQRLGPSSCDKEGIFERFGGQNLSQFDVSGRD